MKERAADHFASPTLVGRQVRLEPLVPSVDPATPQLAGSDTVGWRHIDQASGETAGMTTWCEIDPVARSLAVETTRLQVRPGVALEAELLVLRRAFGDLGCARVSWYVDSRDEDSQAAVERLGACREGVLRKHRRRADGSWADDVLYGMTDVEWPAACRTLEAALDR